jgi:hypothetical protein
LKLRLTHVAPRQRRRTRAASPFLLSVYILAASMIVGSAMVFCFPSRLIDR